MAEDNAKIYQRTSFILLAIIISSLLNVCMFAFQAKAAEPMPMPKINFISDADGNCVAEPLPAPLENLNRPSAPMPECCLAQNRNFNVVVNTANDKSAPTLSGPAMAASDILNSQNNYTYYTSQIVFPPPAELAIISTVIRE